MANYDYYDSMKNKLMFVRISRKKKPKKQKKSYKKER